MSRKISKKSNQKNPSPIAEETVIEKSIITEKNDDIYNRIFQILSIVILILMLGLSLKSGINSDDQFQHDYSAKLLDYYTSFGQNKAALNVPNGQMHYYGGFFDIVTGTINKVLGFTIYDTGYHHVRHLFSALLGFLALFFAARIANTLAGKRAAILTLLFLFLSPRFLGHSMMNPKDIPFAAGYIISIFYIIRLLKTMPQPRWQDGLGFVLGSALAFSTRAGGILLFGYLGLFLLFDFLEKRKEKTSVPLKKQILIYTTWTITLSIAGYILALLWWPFGLSSPILNPLEALSEFSKLGIRIRVLFAGERILSDSEPWYYALVWIYRTVPVFVLIGFVGSFILIKKIISTINPLLISLLWFATLFPLGYIAAKESLLHDGWRHLIFIYPTMVVMSVLFWMHLEKIFQQNKNIKYALYSLLFVTLLEPAYFITKNTAYPYIYFQPLTGGLSGNYGEYETDYWGLSVKEAVNWLEDEGIVSENMSDTITIASNFSYLTEIYLKKYGGHVRTTYTRFQGRYTSEWDYAIFPTRFIYKSQLTNKFPPSRTLHTIESEGIPLAIILRDKEKFAYQATFALEQRDTVFALNQFQKELTAHPDNEQAWLGMADAYLGLADFDKTVYCATEALKICPENVSAMYFKGMGLSSIGQLDQAKILFEQATKTDGEFYIAYYYLAIIEINKGRLESALNYAKTTLEINPRFKKAQLLVAQIYEKAGQKEKGEEFLKRMKKYDKN